MCLAGPGIAGAVGDVTYFMTAEMKADPVRRWALRDRAFFGYGACHILAGVFLQARAGDGYFAERVVPAGSRPGNHVFVTDGVTAFDFHGYSRREVLLCHHVRMWRRQVPEWAARVERVTFDLLDTRALNARKMRGREQYLQDPVPRARAFLKRFDRAGCAR